MNANLGLNDPSAVPNPHHQGEKRKRDSEQALPSAENSGLTGSVTRQRIVEILSHTANGCLSELGYYPGMAGKLKELEVQNVKWKDENVKLYQDNQRLTQMVQNLNANLALSGIPESDKTAKIIQLQNEIRRLQVENEHARLKLLQLPQQHEILVSKYNQLLHSRQLILQENQHLKNYLHGLGVPPLHVVQQQQQQQQQQISQVSTINPNVIIHRNDQHPQLQAQAQWSSSSRPSSAQSLQRGQNQVPQNELTQTQFAAMQHRQHPNSNPSSRRTSLNFVSPTIQSPQVPSQSFAPNVPPHSAPLPQPHGLDASQQQMLHFGPNMRHNMRRASAPNTPLLQGNPYPRIHSHAVDVGPGQSAGPSQASQHISAPIYSSNIPAGNPFFGPGPSRSPAHVLQNNTTSQMQKGEEPMVGISMSPRDMYDNPPPMVQTSPSAIVSPQPLDGQNASLPAIRPENAVYIPFASASTSLPEPDVSMAPSNPPPSSTSERPPQSNDDSALPTEQSNLDETTPEPVDTIASPRDTSAAAEGDGMKIDAVEKEREEEGEEDNEDEDEDEDEVELGPDGLRLVKDCLIHIFGSPVEGRVICKLCEHRFKTGIQDRPPSPFMNATDVELEKHCIEEHQKPWEALREP